MHYYSLPLISQARSQLESILLVTDSPVTVAALAPALGLAENLVYDLLRDIAAELDSRHSGINLRESEEGWRFFTRVENAEVVEKFLRSGTQVTLSRAALETLTVVAYRQPVTRSQVSAVRGVNVDGVMRTLELRGFIKEVPTSDGGSARSYQTTGLFLEQLGIDSLAQLPDLAPLLPEVDSISEEF